jgi:hypothetical protein
MKIFLINKEIQKGSGAKSYMRKDFLLYEEMRKYLVISEEAVSHIRLLNFLIYEENCLIFFNSVVNPSSTQVFKYICVCSIKS